ncbi:MAG: dihydrolipoyl dehydrogenase [Deltaproteobacteria bacterium]|nr:dihydrolipoyl dehydrogenase [Deltaproteobacteria bacterium]
MSEQPYDLVVIGAGPGGYVAAIRAAQLGMRVACVEKEATLGGTCLNLGCIPSKALLDSSELFAQAQHGLAAHGVKLGSVALDLPAMLARKDKVVKLLTTGVAGLFRKNQIERLQGVARIAGPGTVEVHAAGGVQRVAAKRILIASGSTPINLPELPFDGERIISSTEALALPAVPERLLVIGAGAIGLELGSVWNRLGSEVVVAEFMDRIVPGADHQMGDELQKALKRQGFAFHLRTSAKRAEIKGDKVHVTLDCEGKASEEVVDVVLVAVGRRPYDTGLGARELGVAYDERGRIVVDEIYETNVPGIYAVGDVIAGPMLAHRAEEEGIAAVELMAGVGGHVNYNAMPAVVYTWPELASIGWSEEQAAQLGVAVKVGTFPFMANGRARCLGEAEGMVKIVADKENDRLVGVHILGPRASDLIAEAAVAMEFGATAEDLARTVHAHPTLPEAIKEAALAVDKRAIHI